MQHECYEKALQYIHAHICVSLFIVCPFNIFFFLAMNFSDHVGDRSLDEFVKECKQMTISDEHVCKVTPSRIFSLAIHPSGDQSPLIAAGDKNGFVGLWNVVCRFNFLQ